MAGVLGTVETCRVSAEVTGPGDGSMMTLHKLTAGDGYAYLTRQVAAHDATERGYGSLGDYYAEKGESPGVWMGTGVSALPLFPADAADLTLCGPVTEAQMTALFGEGRHPDAERIERLMRAAGHGTPAILAATRLGSPFAVSDAVNPFRQRCAKAFEAHNAREGVPRDWPVPAAARASIRTEIARAMFAAEYDRDPADARELSGYLARISRQATTAVAGYDLTFSPVKSVSALWAIAPRDIAQVVEQAHYDAVADTLGWLEKHASYTRTGRHGVAQIETTGLLAAAFTHRDSRAGDPDLHTHVAISNKVQSAVDGRWLALDGRPLHKMTVAASERYNTRIETLLQQRLGLTFAERPGTDPGKRAVREIVGIPAALTGLWSQRRAAIDERRADLSARFQSEHGRTPTAIEAIALAQRANLETRPHKHAPRSHTEQRATWCAEALGTLGDDAELAEVVAAVLRPGTGPHPARTPTAAWVKETSADVLHALHSRRATWQDCHVLAEAERQARAAGIHPSRVDEAVRAVVAQVLCPTHSIRLGTTDPVTEAVGEPVELRRSDGSSIYQSVGVQLYTSPAVVAAEQQLLAAAGRRGGRVVDDAAIDLALLEATANGVELNPGQIQLVRDLAGSGARLHLALAPAGAGKTTAMRVLTAAWQTPNPGNLPVPARTTDPSELAGHVLGLAPSAAAAAVLREEIGVHTDTLAKLIHNIDTATTDADLPDWARAIGPQSLVIIDEAGMAGTTDLARAVGFVTARGGSVRLVGDDQQLSAIGAGGVLRDIAATTGAIHLSQVMRFTDPAEGAASLALRTGDHAALGYYLDHQRVHVGDQGSVTDAAYRAWSTDRAAGRDAIMLAPTRDLVAQLNARARTDRLAASPAIGDDAGRQVRLADASHASAGDVITTCNNDRRLRITATDWVKNGDRFTVDHVLRDGALRTRHHNTGRYITLPAGYVTEHVTLGYAATVHAAQGITADVSHVVATGQESRQLLYVALTRGRDGNHVYLVTASDGDPHTVLDRDSLLPPTAVDILARILDRDDAHASATSTRRELTAPTGRLGDAVDRYHDALHTAAEALLGTDRLTELATAAEEALPGVTNAPAWPSLRRHLALLAADGHDPARLLTDAVQSRPLTGATDHAAVLDWRLDYDAGSVAGPLAWLPAVPSRLAADPHWGDYLTRRSDLVHDLASQVAAQTARWAPTSTPAWASGLLDATADPQLLADLAVWRAALGIDDTERVHTGPPCKPAVEARHQRGLEQRIHRVLGDPDAATRRWADLAGGLDPRLALDPYWPQLADRVAAAHRAGIDITELAAAVIATGGPLPDDHPAAALWWRLSRHLPPAALAADTTTASTLRPPWTSQLADIAGDHPAQRLVADPAWPALVAAVTSAVDAGWQPAQILRTAYELLDSGHPAEHAPRPEELASALVWRIAMLTDTPHDPAPEPDLEPPVKDDDVASLPPDLRAFGDADADLDDDWPTNLLPPADPAAAAEPGDQTDFPVRPAPGDGVMGVAGDTEHDAPYTYPRAAAPPVVRLVELNAQALAYYVDRYHNSWAPDYLTARLGPDAAQQPWFTPGYAPPGWNHLVEHMHRRGATDAELLAAGLATQARTGRLIDRFRDRLVLPIHHGPDIHGFIARRNPTHDEDDSAGPKYLNTPETDLFTKGAQLFGLHEARDLLAAGAAPVLVEGPLDAFAVTLAGGANGDFVGVAPLGTAFTDRQADQLRPFIGNGKPGIIVATDADRAGQAAAARAYWQLTARGDSPRHLQMPDGQDPAGLLVAIGGDQLRSALAAARPLATSLTAGRIDRYAGRMNTIEGRLAAIRATAEVIGALPPQHWLDHIEALDAQLGAAPGLVHLEVLDAGHAWTLDPDAQARRHLAEHPPADATPAVRWATLGRRIRPDLTAGADWSTLAAALDSAAAAGYDVPAELPQLAATAALPHRDPARELHTRLVADCPAAATVTVTVDEIRLADSRTANRAAERRTAQQAASVDNRPRKPAASNAVTPPNDQARHLQTDTVPAKPTQIRQPGPRR